MSKNFNTNTDNCPVWLTPKWVTDALGDFDLDPCTQPDGERPWEVATVNYCEEQDGLSQDWQGRVWCNPPYGRETFKWLNKLSDHKDGGIALIFARTETIGFHQTVWQKADAVFFFRGRLKFCYPSGNEGGPANAPSCLVAYGAENVQALESCGLDGKLVKL